MVITGAAEYDLEINWADECDQTQEMFHETKAGSKEQKQSDRSCTNQSDLVSD